MHRHVACGMSLALYALSSGLSGQSRATAEAPWRTYRNDRVGFEIQCPANWRIEGPQPGEDSVRFAPPPGETRLAEFWFGPVEPDRASTFRDFAQWIRQYRRDTASAGARILTQRTISVDGYHAVRLTYDDHLPGAPVSRVVDILIGVAAPGREGRVYRLFYEPLRQGAAEDAFYNRVVSSLRITARP